MVLKIVKQTTPAIKVEFVKTILLNVYKRKIDEEGPTYDAAFSKQQSLSNDKY